MFFFYLFLINYLIAAPLAGSTNTLEDSLPWLSIYISGLPTSSTLFFLPHWKPIRLATECCLLLPLADYCTSLPLLLSLSLVVPPSLSLWCGPFVDLYAHGTYHLFSHCCCRLNWTQTRLLTWLSYFHLLPTFPSSPLFPLLCESLLRLLGGAALIRLKISTQCAPSWMRLRLRRRRYFSVQCSPW